MKRAFCLQCLMIMISVLCTSCTYHTYHFGVPSKAAMVPDDFGETEAAIARAEQSAGARLCPDKLAKAKELAHDGAATYWACHNTESSNLLAQARQLAKEVEECGPQAAEPAQAIPPAPACNIVGTPASISKGETANLHWSSQYSSKCDIQPGIGPVSPQGNMPVTPQADTVYTLTCTGAGGEAFSETNIAVKSASLPAPTKDQLCMDLKIEFDTNKAVIKPAYFKEVEKVADFMKMYPRIKGTIEGHTDNVGPARYNLKLSWKRASSVVKMLVGKYSIDESRLSAKGYGLTRPIADNGTMEGRQKNRRAVANFGCVPVEK